MNRSNLNYKIIKPIFTLIVVALPLLTPSVVNSSVLEYSPCKKYANTFRKYRDAVNQFRSQPDLAAKGISVHDDIQDKQHAKCLDDFIREESDGKYGIFRYEDEYLMGDARS